MLLGGRCNQWICGSWADGIETYCTRLKKTIDQAAHLSACEGRRELLRLDFKETIRSKRTELDRLIERDDALQRRVAHDGHEVATDRQQDEGDIDMQDERGRASDDKGRTKEGASCRTSSA